MFTNKQLEVIIEALEYQTEINAEVLPPESVDNFKDTLKVARDLLNANKD